MRDRVPHDGQDPAQVSHEQTRGRDLVGDVVVDFRQLGEVVLDFDEVQARLLHVVLVAHRARRVVADRVGLGLVVAGDVHEFRGGLRAGAVVVALHVTVGLVPVVGGQVARHLAGTEVHRLGFRVDLSVDVADGAGAGVLELLAVSHGVPARSDVARVVALEVRVAAVTHEVGGVVQAGLFGAELGALEVGVPGTRVDAVTRLRRAIPKSVGGDDSAVQVADELFGDAADDGVELRVVGHGDCLVCVWSLDRTNGTYCARYTKALCVPSAVRESTPSQGAILLSRRITKILYHSCL